MAHFVYIIKSLKDSRFYIGETADVERRLFEHNEGWVKSTRNRRPFLMVHSEVFVSRSEALKREKQIKAYKGGEAFKRLFSKKEG
jgi:putative endonuclease